MTTDADIALRLLTSVDQIEWQVSGHDELGYPRVIHAQLGGCTFRLMHNAISVVHPDLPAAYSLDNSPHANNLYIHLQEKFKITVPDRQTQRDTIMDCLDGPLTEDIPSTGTIGPIRKEEPFKVDGVW